MDLTALLARIRDSRENTVSFYRGGEIVRRDFADVYADVIAAVHFLERCGVRQGSRVGIIAPNGYEYMVYDLALIEVRAVSVAFTEDFGDRDPGELFERYGLALLLTATRQRSRHVTALPIACIDEDCAPVQARAGAVADCDPAFERPFRIFSSGSAGGVKGVFMSRRGVEATIATFVDRLKPRADDVLLLFLPMSNFQQRMMYYAALWYGFNLLIADPPRLFHALRAGRPTMLIAPPALYESIETRIANLPFVRRSFHALVSRVLSAMPAGPARAALGRRLYAEVHRTFGGRMRFMVTGMAPIRQSALRLFERMGFELYETYGLIECGTVTLNTPPHDRRGTVGRPVPGVDVSFEPDGEIIVSRDPMMAAGYFECADGEAETTFVAPGRVATGDIGWLDEDGFLHLTGRKKEIIVTQGGDKVHPELLEAQIDASVDVAKSVVFRRSADAALTAVVVPRRAPDRAARQRIRSLIDRIGDERPSFRITDVVFTEEAFSRENGLLRPNLKIDRRRIAQRFQGQPAPAAVSHAE